MQTEFTDAATFVETSFVDPATTSAQLDLEAEAIVMGAYEADKSAMNSWIGGLLFRSDDTDLALIANCLSTVVNLTPPERYEEVAGLLAKADPSAVFLTSFENLSKSWARTDPAKAEQWAVSIEDTEQFVAASNQVLRRLSEKDPTVPIAMINGPLIARADREAGQPGAEDWLSPLVQTYIDKVSVYHARTKEDLTAAYRSLAVIQNDDILEQCRDRLSAAHA